MVQATHSKIVERYSIAFRSSWARRKCASIGPGIPLGKLAGNDAGATKSRALATLGLEFGQRLPSNGTRSLCHEASCGVPQSKQRALGRSSLSPSWQSGACSFKFLFPATIIWVFSERRKARKKNGKANSKASTIFKGQIRPRLRLLALRASPSQGGSS